MPVRLLLVLTLAMRLRAADAAAEAEFFEAKIRPLLAAYCYTCHTQTQMGGLRLDSREAVLAGGKSGPAIQPGKPAESLLIQAVERRHDRLKMPPTAPLPPDQTALLAEWVRRGAPWPASKQTQSPAAAAPGSPYRITAAQRAFWSFQPVRKPALPKVRQEALVRTPVDRFILEKLEAKGLKPAAEADRRTWIRRATLDMTGLPPAPADVEAFVNDKSPKARETVVERLLASPHYGERWARHWLDLARYSDGQLAAGADTPFPNAWRYRDWVVDAFNRDLPYDRFVKAQIAADLLPEPERGPLMAGLGFQALGSRGDDQVDVTSKVFLGLTVGCAQCHDHKYDPIPTRDYYSMVGIFRSSQIGEHPLVGAAEVDRYKQHKKKIDDLKEVLDDFLAVQQKQLVDMLARHTADYMLAAWKRDFSNPALDKETLDRWVAYLARNDKEHPYLKPWFDAVAGSPSEDTVRQAAARYQAYALDLIDRAKEVDDKNYVAFGGRKGIKDERTRQYTNIVSLPVLEFYQWRELASGPYNIDGFRAPAGIYYYGPKELDRWLTGFARAHVEQLRAEIRALESGLPPMYPFVHALHDDGKPADARVAIRGDGKNLGETAPRGFLQILCDGTPAHFNRGSGRLELAEAIASPSNPLTARVMVNRLWQHHFGRGIVATPSNFGQMGERPTHPELLDWLAARLVESGWSLKAVHREILLSRTYAQASSGDARNAETDPANLLLWRASVRPRLDLESIRDSVLTVSGALDRTAGGPPKPPADDNLRRSLYMTVSRTRLDATMALFDFPDANATAEQRAVTIGPLQGLFFLNSKFISAQAAALGTRLEKEAGPAAEARIRRAYALLYGRGPDAEELKLGIEYVASGGRGWQQYLQALLGSGEFTSVN